MRSSAIAPASSSTPVTSVGVPDTLAPTIAMRSRPSFSVRSTWAPSSGAGDAGADAGDEHDVDRLVLEQPEPGADRGRR